MSTQMFPKLIEFRGGTAKIYLQNARNHPRYEVRYFDLDGSKQRVTFSTCEQAREFAGKVLEELSRRRSNFITLRGREALEYQQLTDLLASLGLTLPEGTAQLSEIHRILGGSADPREAVKYYMETRPRKESSTTVREVVDRFIDLKTREGEIGGLHLRDLESRLGRFAKQFDRPIARVTPDEIREYLLSMEVGLRTRHNHRTTLTMLYKYAAAEGYLPADHKGVLQPAKRTRMKMNVTVFTPQEMTRLLASADGDQMVALAICAFAGIRSEELKRLQWENLNFKEGHIVVPDSVAKCQTRRIVPMTDNLKAWLTPLRKESGPVCPFSNLSIVFTRTGSRAEVKWKKNGLRHSYISYRVAQTKNVNQVALEAGNSATMIFRHYLKFVGEEEAREWFAIMPPATSRAGTAREPGRENIIPMPRAA